MTIKQHAYRDNGGGEVLLSTQDKTLDGALESMLKFELGYGGVPHSVTPTRVEVHTRVLNCFDRTVWEGTEEEMRPLVEVVAAFLHTMGKDVNKAVANILAPKLCDMTKGNPFLITSLMPMMTGRLRLKLLCLVLCDSTTDEVAVKRAEEMDIEDVISVVTLSMATGHSFSEICDQLAL